MRPPRSPTVAGVEHVEERVGFRGVQGVDTVPRAASSAAAMPVGARAFASLSTKRAMQRGRERMPIVVLPDPIAPTRTT